MRILVTGATGFIGRSLVHRLAAEEDFEVTALVRQDYRERTLPADFERLLPKIPLLIADLRDFEAVIVAVQAARPDLIYHLAAAGVWDPFLPINLALAHNLHGTVNLLRAAFELQEAGKTPVQMIISRTPGELSAMNHYAASKGAAWQICQMYGRTQGWPVVGAMIFQAYGPGQGPKNLIPAALAAALEGRDFPMTVGSQQRDWIYVDDVVRGLLAVAKAGLPAGGSVDLGSGRLISVADVVRKIYAMVGGKGRPLIGTLPTRPGEEELQVADARITQELTGWAADIELGEGLNRLLELNL